MPKEFARGCAVFSSLLCGLALADQTQPARSPLLVVLNGDPKQWQPLARELGWQLLTPKLANLLTDKGMQDFQGSVTGAIRQPGADDGRVYLIGQAPETPAVFYIASRWPEPWAAAVALAGTPRPAIDTNRLFGINTRLVPVLWVAGKNNEGAPLIQKLKAGEYNVEVREEATPQQIFTWLAQHRRDPLPAEVDCETDSPAFPGCYWIQVTRFDPAERNDVLTSTRVQAGSGATLDLGGFGFNPQGDGPGVLVGFLPKDYKGPLKLNDRIVSIAGKAIRDPRDYMQQMDQTTEEKPVAVMVERGAQRVRLETRIVLPARAGTVTARVQGRYLPDLKQIQIVSRAVAQMRITVSQDWVPSTINWNGSDLDKAESPGCWLLDEQKELLSARKCP